jgi:hypothetical protein
LAYQALVGLPENFIQRETAHAILDGMRDYYAKQNYFTGGERSLNEALNQALKIKAVKTAVGLSAKPWEVRAGSHTRTLLPEAELQRTGQPIMLAVWKSRSPQNRLFTEM